MENRLKEVIFSLTNRCNLRCTMCQIPEMSSAELSTEEIKTLILDISNLHPNSIVFSGGEPLMREDIFELISFANQHKINTCITSNGTLIDEKKVKLLSSCGLGVINISIDGPQDVHDAIRGKGNFAKAVFAIELLAKYKIETTIATVISSQSFKSLPYVMDLAYKFGVTTVKFQPFSDIFLIDKERGRNLFCAAKDLGHIRKNIETTIKLSKKYKIATNPQGYLRAIPEYICGLRKRNNYFLCPALWSSCPISAEGDVHLCWVLSEIVIGNVKDAKLSELWNSTEHQRLRQSAGMEKCSGCLMSCYDYNFGNYNVVDLFFLKMRKLTGIKFYKRQYFRFYQYSYYLFRKIINSVSKLTTARVVSSKETDIELAEIKAAKEILINKIKAFKKNGKS